MRKYTFNENFFKTINNDSAYVLGWIASDGNVINKPGYKYVVRMELADYDALENINKLVGGNSIIYKTSNKVSQLYALKYHSKIMVEDLINLGVTPNKAKTIQLPNIPRECMKHFIRGYFDGDGSVYIQTNGKYKRLKSYICSASRDILESIGIFLKEEIGLIPKIYQENPKGYAPHYKLAYGSKESYALYKYMYEDCEENFLKRKKDIFEYSQEHHIGICIKKCKKCGKELVDANGNQRYCYDCKKEVLKERDRIKSIKRREKRNAVG